MVQSSTRTPQKSLAPCLMIVLPVCVCGLNYKFFETKSPVPCVKNIELLLSLKEQRGLHLCWMLQKKNEEKCKTFIFLTNSWQGHCTPCSAMFVRWIANTKSSKAPKLLCITVSYSMDRLHRCIHAVA